MNLEVKLNWEDPQWSLQKCEGSIQEGAQKHTQVVYGNWDGLLSLNSSHSTALKKVEYICMVVWSELVFFLCWYILICVEVGGGVWGERKLILMDILMGMVDGMSFCISTLWDLQEMRFSAIFDDVSWLAMTVIMAAISCFIAIRRRWWMRSCTCIFLFTGLRKESDDEFEPLSLLLPTHFLPPFFLSFFFLVQSIFNFSLPFFFLFIVRCVRNIY